jgi:hypothetical protein
MTPEALKLLFQEELARMHLPAEHLFVSLSIENQWHADLRIRGREFELGSAFYGGFYCRQATPRGKVSFIPADVRPIFGGHELLVRSGLLMILGGMDDPETAAAGPAAL